jgi:3-hydroxyacyl-CoA dehydrogenase/enoyl-CoA hydratase/3-hydroxybutyryl-CoA epimerase
MAGTTVVYDSIALKVDKAGIAWLTLDCPGKANVLSSIVMEELGSAFAEIASDDRIKAVILVSEKPHTFASGADLQEILKFKNQDQAYQLVKRGHKVFARLADLEKPVVVGIKGRCLGGGLELALCADRRIAAKDNTTQLGLPEVTLGLLPGLGGTQRLPRLIGLKPAIDLILSGKPVSAARACELGLVDEVIEVQELRKRLEEVALELIASPKLERPDALTESADKHKSVLATSQRAIRIRTRGQYPAFSKVIEVIAESITSGLEAGLEAEAKAFSELAASDIAHNLIGLFFAQELAVRSGSKNHQSESDQTKNTNVGIVGAGMMGSGIASLCGDAGYPAYLVETDHNRLTAAVDSINKKLGVPAVHAMSLLKDLNQVQIVIEAIHEDLETKINLFKDLEQIVPSNCLLASNTSCLSITNIANSLKHGNRLLGMHFFHPADRMPLVEVIVHAGADQQSIDEAAALTVKVGKVPVVVNDGPGFLVNRILCPYLIESALIAEEGTPLSWIEEAAISFGMPMGPFALMDEIGLDISFKVAKLLHESFDGRLSLPELMHKMESLGLLGKKNNAGFYSYDESGSRKSFNMQLVEFARLKTSEQKLPAEQAKFLQERLILPMIDESARCLTEKIVRKPRQADLAMVLGTGFPGFRGGPLRYADKLGIARCVETLNGIYKTRKVSPAELLVLMAAEEKKFYYGQG